MLTHIRETRLSAIRLSNVLNEGKPIMPQRYTLDNLVGHNTSVMARLALFSVCLALHKPRGLNEVIL